MTDPLHVLVVDDSAVMRLVMTTLLGEEPGMQVTVAADPMIALQKMKIRRPDVVVLDLEMPRMDGLTFLRTLMRDDPMPVVVCSGSAGRGSENALSALQAGALEIVAKPKVGLREFLVESKELLLGAIRGAAEAKLCVAPLLEGRLQPAGTVARRSRNWPAEAGPPQKLIAIAASTGGTEALRVFVEGLPRRCPPTLIVQHMPAGFTTAFAAHLDRLAEPEVREARDGDEVREGRVLIAPGDRHMELAADGKVRITAGPLVSRHRPSADVLFRSVAGIGGAMAVGIIMTGMGDDGAEGLLAMRRAGATTFAQDEASCVVFGMPREAVRRGAVVETLALSDLAGRALEACV
jgi:two-component system chemotaxis response regulator CheB